MVIDVRIKSEHRYSDRGRDFRVSTSRNLRKDYKTVSLGRSRWDLFLEWSDTRVWCAGRERESESREKLEEERIVSRRKEKRRKETKKTNRKELRYGERAKARSKEKKEKKKNGGLWRERVRTVYEKNHLARGTKTIFPLFVCSISRRRGLEGSNRAGAPCKKRVFFFGIGTNTHTHIR